MPASTRRRSVLFLHDFSFTPPAMLLAKLRRPAAPMGEMQGLADMAEMSGMPKMSGMGGMDLNDVDFDAFLANDRTLADPEVTRVEAGGHIRLRVINGASGTNFWLDLGALRGMLIATDGVPVKPVTGSRFPIAMAQRLDILVRLPGAGAFPVLALREGDTARAGIVLATPGASVARLASMGATIAPAVDNSLEMQLAAGTPLSPRPVDRRIAVTLSGSMQPYVWMMNSQSWPTITPLRVAKGDRVEITMTNMSMMVHPMHLHGHRFQVVAMNGKPLSGAVRDTVLVEPKSAVTIAFDANNPGRWLFHCHNLYHMASGMMSMIAYDGISVPTLMPA